METLESHLAAQLRSSRDFFWHRLRAAAVARFLPRGRPFRLLDLGAGAGLFGEFLREALPECAYHFVEPLQSLERELESRFGAERNAKAAADLRSFDAVVLLDVLEHQKDDRAFLRDLAARMRPGALLVLTVPALQALWSPWDQALGHFRRYDKAALSRAAEGLPLRWVEKSYLFPELVPLGLYRKLRLGKRKLEQADEHFPNLPRPLNESLYWLGRLSLGLRRLSPFGTSLLGALEVF
jgi:SAM-dependent methyltransferase